MNSDAIASPSRRQLLAGVSALAAGSLTAGGFPNSARAKAPMLNTKGPGFYRFKHGEMEATVITDGPLSFPDSTKIFRGAPDDEIKKLLTDQFLAPDQVRMEQNILVLNTGDRIVLFDTGVHSMRPPNAPTGRILTSLKEGGIDPKDVDAIVLTHPHIDHAGGIMSPDGKERLFPNAQIYMNEADLKFWSDDQRVGTPAESSLRTVQKNVLPNRDRLVMVKDGQEILPGIQAIASHGHTVGHTSYMISSGGKQLCLTGDIAHHEILLRRPKMSISFDTDGAAAAASRVKMCDMLASQRIPALIYHLPWPGIGNLARDGDGYRFVPVAMAPV